MGKLRDVTCETFGKLFVLGKFHTLPDKRARWVCRCECGNLCVRRARQLTEAYRKAYPISCGCLPFIKSVTRRTNLALTGVRFGKLVIQKWHKDRQRWEALCDCGNTVWVGSGDLHKGEGRATIQCKKCSNEANRKKLIQDLHGRIFGRLVVTKQITFAHPVKWKCLCECGGTIVTQATSLIQGHVSSCGCLRVEHLQALGLRNRTDRTGETFGFLTILAYVTNNREKVICKCICGSVLETYMGNVQSGTRKSCGCRSRGVHHHHYDPSLTDEERAGRHRVQGVDNWRRAVYTRDNYDCQSCGAHGGRLVVHHIKSWVAHPGLRFSKRNGVTLCKRCHDDFHGKHGRRRRRGEQNWKQFIPWLREMRSIHGFDIQKKIRP